MTRFVHVKGVKIHFLENGSTQEGAPVLLMVHGWAGSVPDWERLLGFLPSGLRAIAIDLPGCGISDKPDAPYDMAYFLDTVHSFCESVGVSSMVLAGHSMGGQIAIHYTSRYPDMVEKLILIDPYGLDGQEGGRRALARLGPVVNLVFLLNTRLFIEWAMRVNVLYDAPPDLVNCAVEAAAVSILGWESSRAISRITKRLVGRELVEALLPGISQETLVIWGKEDKLFPPRWADGYMSRLRRATLHLVAETGHMPMFEAPEKVASLITAFLEG